MITKYECNYIDYIVITHNNMVIQIITLVLHACNAHVITCYYMLFYTPITWLLHVYYMHVMLMWLNSTITQSLIVTCWLHDLLHDHNMHVMPREHVITWHHMTLTWDFTWILRSYNAINYKSFDQSCNYMTVHVIGCIYTYYMNITSRLHPRCNINVI